jgi:putative ABC transport system permease protein
MLLQTWRRFPGMAFMALRSLQMHKLRSALTVLGLVFGVASVIVMLAVAEGANRETLQQIESLGVKNVIIRSVKPAANNNAQISFRNFENSYGIKYDDLRRIEETIPTLVNAAPMREFVQIARFGEAKFETARVLGVRPSYFRSNRLNLAQGRFLEELDERNSTNVCVIGFELAQQLFRNRNPLGQSIQVANLHYFRVVGISGYRTPSAGIGSSLSAQDYNFDIYIPLSTDRNRIGPTLFKLEQGSFSLTRLELSQITVEVSDREAVRETATALSGLMRRYHPTEDYAITIPLDLLEQAKATQRIFNIVLGATAAISLLVGGIGIMNIMLASVSERTQEIGIRRALGAKQVDIIAQFLVETATLSLIGTLIGVLVGLAAPYFVTWVSGMETRVTIWSVLIATAVSFSVGIIFGIYPARRAARLDPIEALRRI